MIDMNHGSEAVYGGAANAAITGRINALIDNALVDRNRAQTPRTYLGGSRIGEPCARKLVYEYTRTTLDAGKGFDGRTVAGGNGQRDRHGGHCNLEFHGCSPPL